MSQKLADQNTFECLTQYDPIFNEITNNDNQHGKNFLSFLCTLYD